MVAEGGEEEEARDRRRMPLRRHLLKSHTVTAEALSARLGPATLCSASTSHPRHHHTLCTLHTRDTTLHQLLVPIWYSRDLANAVGPAQEVSVYYLCNSERTPCSANRQGAIRFVGSGVGRSTCT